MASVSFLGPAGAADSQRRRSPDPRGTQPSNTPAPHKFGIGGQIGVSNRGASGGMRYWFGERVGMDLSAGWYRGRTYSPTISTPSTTMVTPSVLILLTKPDPNANVDIRPFVGGGVSYVRGGIVNPLVTQTEVRGGTGMHAFGGVEMTFKELESIAISAELAYFRLPLRFGTGTVIDGMNYFVLFHYYLK